MASELKHTVAPSGGDFTSLDAALDHLVASHSNLVTADVYALVEISGTWSSADATAVSVSGITTDATRYLRIYTAGSARHHGKYSTSHYLLNVNAATPVTISAVDYVYLDGLQLTRGGGGILLDQTSWSAGMHHYISGNIFNATGILAWNPLVLARGPGATSVMRYWNNLFSNHGSNGYGLQINDDADYTIYLYNNTFKDCTYGVNNLCGGTIGKNNLFSGCANPATGTWAAGTDYNATNNASVGYTVTGGGNTHDRTSQTFTFVDESGDDFHLSSSDAGAKDYGVSDPGSGLFSDDIDGTTRSGSWDIGADEYVSSGYSLSCDGGTYTLTGTAVSTLKGSLVAADAGSYTLTGQDIAALFGHLISAEAGAYQLTGQDAATLFGRKLAAEAGSYAVTGQDVALVYVPGGGAYVITAEGGVYAITGADAGLRKAHILPAEPGAYILAGQDAATLLGRLLDAGAGAYALTGADAALLRAAKIAIEAGVYAVTGADATLSLSTALAEAILKLLRPAQRIVLSPTVPRIVDACPAQRIVLTDRSDA